MRWSRSRHNQHVCPAPFAGTIDSATRHVCVQPRDQPRDVITRRTGQPPAGFPSYMQHPWKGRPFDHTAYPQARSRPQQEYRESLTGVTGEHETATETHSGTGLGTSAALSSAHHRGLVRQHRLREGVRATTRRLSKAAQLRLASWSAGVGGCVQTCGSQEAEEKREGRGSTPASSYREASPQRAGCDSVL